LANIITKAVFKAGNSLVNWASKGVANTYVTNKDTFQLIPIGGRYGFKVLNNDGVIKAYAECPPLSAIINKKGRAANNGVHKLYRKGGSEVKGYSPFKDIIKSPNPCITGNQFRVNSQFIAQLYGYCVILKTYPVVGFELEAPPNLWIVPPSMVKVTWSEDYLFAGSIIDLIKEITYTPPGSKTIKLEREDVYILTGEQPSLSHPYLTESVLTGQEEVISGLINLFNTQNSLIESRGAIGMITPDQKDGMGQTFPLMDSEKEIIQSDFKKYGTLKDKFKYIITNQSLKFTAISAPIREMMLQETAKQYTQALCDAIGFPYGLMSEGGNTTFSNQNSYKKELYTDFIIPTDVQWCQQYDEMSGITEAGFETKVDYSHLSILADDEKEKSEVRKNNVASIRTQFLSNMIKWDNALILLGEQPIGGENGGKYFYQLDQEIQQTFTYGKDTNQTNGSGNNQGNQGQGENNQV